MGVCWVWMAVCWRTVQLVRYGMSRFFVVPAIVRFDLRGLWSFLTNIEFLRFVLYSTLIPLLLKVSLPLQLFVAKLSIIEFSLIFSKLRLVGGGCCWLMMFVQRHNGRITHVPLRQCVAVKTSGGTVIEFRIIVLFWVLLMMLLVMSIKVLYGVCGHKFGHFLACWTASFARTGWRASGVVVETVNSWNKCEK